MTFPCLNSWWIARWQIAGSLVRKPEDKKSSSVPSHLFSLCYSQRAKSPLSQLPPNPEGAQRSLKLCGGFCAHPSGMRQWCWHGQARYFWKLWAWWVWNFSRWSLCMHVLYPAPAASAGWPWQLLSATFLLVTGCSTLNHFAQNLDQALQWITHSGAISFPNFPTIQVWSCDKDVTIVWKR